MTSLSAEYLENYYEEKALRENEIALTYDHASAYKRYFYRSRFEAIMGALNPQPGETILDLGCGTGYYTKAILGKGAKVTAVEYSGNYLAQAAQYVGENQDVSYVKASATDLPFADQTFDRVLFTEIIEHIPNYQSAIGEIYRILKPGGQAVISTPSKYSPMNLAYYLKRWKRHYAFNEHVHEFTYPELRRLLAQKFTVSGFSMANYVIPYPIDNLVLKIQTDNLTIRAIRRWDRLLSRTPVIRFIGWTMIFSVRKEQS